MKITDVMIERFGVWHNLNLPVQKHGLTVIHGPNEAGKSTLMRFIRGMLYGFSIPTGSDAKASSELIDSVKGWGGRVRLRHQGETYELSRSFEEHGRQKFQAQKLGQRQETLSTAEFETLLQQVDADVYQTIYTLGLKELRELANLQTEKIGEYIYGSSLGTVGQRLLTAEARTRTVGHRWLNEEGKGPLFDLSGEYHSLKEALSQADHLMQRYRQGLQECKKLIQQQEGRQQRLEKLQQERLSLQYLYRVWNPWKRQRELKQELSRFANLTNFPADGIRQLESLERKIDTASRKLKALEGDQSRLKKTLQAEKKQYELQEHASGLRALIDLRELIETAERHLAAVTADAALLKAEFDEKLGAIGPGWTLQKLDAVDTSPEAHAQLVQASKNYQNALMRRSRHRKRYQKVSDANHNRQTDLQDKLKKRKINSLDQAIKEAQQRLKELEKLAQLHIKETEYDQRIRSAQTQLQKYREGSEFPWWASVMLTAFAVGGGFLVIAGMLKSVQTSWLIGLIYMLTGVMGGGLAWALRQHFETDNYQLHTKLQHEISDCQKKLNEVRDQISRITGISYNVRAVYNNPETQRSQLNETEMIRQATQKLTELEALARTEERILKTRKKLSVQRGKLPNYQRNVSMARQAWCDLLKKLGLTETIRSSEAFQNWQLSVDASQSLLNWKAAQEDVQRQTELLRMFREKLEEISQRMNLNHKKNSSLTQLLAHWQKLLEELERVKISYQKHRQEYRDLCQQVELAESELQHLKADLQDLLQQGQSASVEQFRLHAQQFQRLGELRALLNDVTDQMNSLTREEPSLAIVEEDLIQFNAQKTQDRIDLIALEIEELEQDLAAGLEELGRLRQSLSTWEGDTTTVDLQARQMRVLDRTQDAIGNWIASQQATQTLSQMAVQFEQQFQPETLARASHYLLQLTCGRYEQVRTPFGSRNLVIHEQHGATRAVHELSDGTREQLFLAIRMALVDMLAEEGVELPMVMDDICVNFDQERTEAAVRTISQFAKARQVLFFTCHMHLAQMFQHQDLEPIWLPKHNTTEWQRLAG